MADPNPDPAATEAEPPDSMDRVTPLRRVDSVGTVMVPIHRELDPPKPAKPERAGMSLVLKPYTPRSNPHTMSTMSDLTSQSNPREVKDIARVRHRHFSAQTTAVRETGDAKAGGGDKAENK
ncbi:MAG: hypothetical protein FJ100_05795 [Deltaproteobacteria bacterium]|nr:hypothetical protein [Deltaproteobacteria bacterium]